MAKRSEEVRAGAVVVVGIVLFLTALVSVGGVNLFRKKRVTYTTYFKFAGGLEPGAFVRFGGLKVGVVQSAEIDPKNSTRIRVKLSVNSDTPIRADSQARISTLGFLGENYLEISPGTQGAPLLKDGAEVPAAEIVQLADVFNNVNNVTLNANKLVTDIDQQVVTVAKNVDQLVTNFNSVMREENLKRIDAILANIDGVLAENRAPLKSSLANIDTASAKLGPTMDNANKTITSTKTLADNLNATIGENRTEIHDTLINLRTALIQVRELMGDMQSMLDNNRGNLDESLENIRVSSQNLKALTDQVKRQPFSLIRIKPEKDHVPPASR